MRTVIRVSPRDSAKTWALLVRHSPGVALPDRTFVVSEEAVRALPDAGIRFSELSREATMSGPAPVKEYDLYVPLAARGSHMNTLTPELKQAVEQAGDTPVRLTEPESHRAYILVSAKVFERLLVADEDRHEQAAFRQAAKKNARARLEDVSQGLSG